MPHQTIDPIVIASQIINAIQTIVSRSIDPVDKALVSITKINAGSAHNIISNEAIFGGTIRTFKKETRSYVEKRINEITEGIAKAHGAEVKIKFDLTNKYPPTYNSKKESIFASQVAKDLVGEDNVQTDIDPCMGGEDFSFFSNIVPGFYYRLGMVKPGTVSGGHHTPTFRADDSCISVGMEAMSTLIVDFMKAGGLK